LTTFVAKSAPASALPSRKTISPTLTFSSPFEPIPSNGPPKTVRSVTFEVNPRTVRGPASRSTASTLPENVRLARSERMTTVVARSGAVAGSRSARTR